MSPPLALCPSCRRHVRVTDPACPFCASPLEGVAPAAFDPQAVPRRVAHVALAVSASLALGACPAQPRPTPVYGAPPMPRADASAPRSTPDAAARPPGTVDDDGSRSEIYGAPPRPPTPRPDASPPGTVDDDGGRSEIYGAPPRPR